MSECNGIILNTFNALEGKTIKALQEGSCFPDESNPAPIFCIGPVMSLPGGEKDENGCLSWLESQPSQSVVLLSFGSLGRFSKTQLTHIAIGLEKSEQRFLWVVKVLSHDSVGGFVTHCGWNSVLEAIGEGFPMVAWPLYAEQHLNKIALVKEMKIALALKETENGIVSATELGDRVKELMDSEKGREIRETVLKMKESSVEARSEGGSSYVDLNRLTLLWKEKDHLSLLSPNTPLLSNFYG
ncbi:unnamed protein product [Lupinus luteus]|uniref:Uncharacterized protein n=1 Tax=Lupinus luteus TaxID=3873 RepID=A0AAV1YH00_LUPLU